MARSSPAAAWKPQTGRETLTLAVKLAAVWEPQTAREALTLVAKLDAVAVARAEQAVPNCSVRVTAPIGVDAALAAREC